MKARYDFAVSPQANLLGQCWARLGRYTHENRKRFDEKKYRSQFFNNQGMGNYTWSFPPSGTCGAYGRFMSYYVNEVIDPQGTVLDLFLKDSESASNLDLQLAEKLGQAETILVEWMGMHKDGFRFFGRELHTAQLHLYSPHNHLDWWENPSRPERDSCYMQIHRIPLGISEGDCPEYVILTTPTLYTGVELKSRSLTALRLHPNGIPPEVLEKKLWQQAHWTDFCVDRTIPSEKYIQALGRWGEYLSMEPENSPSFGFFLCETDFNDLMVEVVVSALDHATVAIPELEWVLETLWNEQPRVSLWGASPKSLNRYLCTQKMLNRVTGVLIERKMANILPRHVLMARAIV